MGENEEDIQLQKLHHQVCSDLVGDIKLQIVKSKRPQVRVALEDGKNWPLLTR